MNIEELDLDPEIIKMDGYDNCIIGIASCFGKDDVLAYNVEKIIQSLESQGMTNDEAWEYMEYNMMGAYVGERTPIFIFTK